MPGWGNCTCQWLRSTALESATGIRFVGLVSLTAETVWYLCAGKLWIFSVGVTSTPQGADLVSTTPDATSSAAFQCMSLEDLEERFRVSGLAREEMEEIRMAAIPQLCKSRRHAVVISEKFGQT
jgi:hypothetical protein